MRICLIGDASPPDEARKVFLHNVSARLTNHEVHIADLRAVRTRRFWRDLRAFQPDIVHYVPGASPASFAATRMLKSHSGAKISVISAMFHPFHEGTYSATIQMWKRLRWSIRLAPADAVLVQSPSAERAFGNLGCNVQFFAGSGVDLQRFAPASPERRDELRARFGIRSDRFVVLHVGSIRRWRNVDKLRHLALDPAVQVVIVGRRDTAPETDVEEELRAAGCTILHDYVPRVEDLYQLADLYVFPTTTPVGAIDVPLSVLEALACNVPVVSTPFEGLPYVLPEAPGLRYASPEDFPRLVQEVISAGSAVTQTRKLVERLDWQHIADGLVQVYDQLLAKRNGGVS